MKRIILTWGGFVLFLAICLWSSGANAATYTWGGGNLNWSNTGATGWNGGPPNSLSDTAVISSGTIGLDNSYSCGTLSFGGAGYVVNSSGTHSLTVNYVTTGSNTAGQIQTTGGSLSILSTSSGTVCYNSGVSGATAITLGVSGTASLYVADASPTCTLLMSAGTNGRNVLSTTSGNVTLISGGTLCYLKNSLNTSMYQNGSSGKWTVQGTIAFDSIYTPFTYAGSNTGNTFYGGIAGNGLPTVAFEFSGGSLAWSPTAPTTGVSMSVSVPNVTVQLPTLPAVGNVATGTSYGYPGNLSTGTYGQGLTATAGSVASGGTFIGAAAPAVSSGTWAPSTGGSLITSDGTLTGISVTTLTGGTAAGNLTITNGTAASGTLVSGAGTTAITAGRYYGGTINLGASSYAGTITGSYSGGSTFALSGSQIISGVTAPSGTGTQAGSAIYLTGTIPAVGGVTSNQSSFTLTSTGGVTSYSPSSNGFYIGDLGLSGTNASNVTYAHHVGPMTSGSGTTTYTGSNLSGILTISPSSLVTTSGGTLNVPTPDQVTVGALTGLANSAGSVGTNYPNRGSPRRGMLNLGIFGLDQIGMPRDALVLDSAGNAIEVKRPELTESETEIICKRDTEMIRGWVWQGIGQLIAYGIAAVGGSIAVAKLVAIGIKRFIGIKKP